MLLQTIRSPLRWLPARLRLGWTALACLSVAVMSFELLAAGAVYGVVDRAARGAVESSLLALVAAVFLARSVLVWGAAVLQSRMVSESIAFIFERLLAGYLGAPFQLHLSQTSAQRTQRLTVAIDTAYRLVLASAMTLAGEFMVMLGLAALIVIVAPPAAGAVVVLLGAGAAALLIISRKSVGRWGREQYVAGEETIGRLQDIQSGIREIKSGQRESEFHAHAAAVQRKFTDAMRRHLLALSMPRVLTEAAFAIVAIALVLIISGRQTIGILALFAYAGLRLIPSANRVVFHIDHIRHGAHAVAELDAALREVAPYDLPLRTRRDFSFRETIEVDDVSFAYDDVPALHRVALTIRRGEWVGLAGDNGSGKSTLLDLIAGLLEPSSGAVRIDGRPLGDWLRTSPPAIGYVAQRPHLFDTPALSAGQTQRIALEQVLREPPEIVLLDEPGTALDAEAEAHLMDQLRAVHGKTTLIVVSHRTETLRHCDRVVVLHDGRIFDPASSSATMART